jgi:perosamine synthetase
LPRIPVYEPVLTADDLAAVTSALREGSISGTAPPVTELERVFCTYTGMPHAVAVASGTAALELAVAGLGLGPGDAVLCPAFTIISCVRAIVLAGATPVLVDVDPRTYCIDVEQAATRVGPRTRAILAVHAFGHPYDHDGLLGLARRGDLAILEDAAQAHGARVRAADRMQPCGGLGDVSVFSFYANKPVTTGEGGMVLARSAAVTSRVRELANLCMGKERRFVHEELGHNYRLSSIQAALGVAQLARLERTIAVKRRIAGQYRERLARLEDVELQSVVGDVEPIHWMNVVVLSDSVPADAQALGQVLARRGIETRPLFTGLHEQPALLSRGFFRGERHPVTERLSRRGLYLPSGLSLDESTIDRVVRELSSALAELRVARVAVPIDTTPGPGSNDEPRLPEASPLDAVFGGVFAGAYDALYAEKDYAAEVALLESAFTRFSEQPVRRVLDLGCGTGRHVAELAARGHQAVGVDRSPAMLAVARRRVPGSRFVEADMAALDLGEKFDAVVVLFAALSYSTTPAAIRAAVGGARRHLVAGGLLVADVWFGAAPSSGRPVTTRRTGHAGGVDWERTGFLSRDPLAQRVDAAYRLTRRSADGEAVAHEVHRMHYFSPFELEFVLELCGFQLLHLSAEGDLDRAPGEGDLTALFVARAR